MKKRAGSLIALFFLWMIPWLAGHAEGTQAQDITYSCTYSVLAGQKHFSWCMDRKYSTYWSANRSTDACMEVTAPEGETVSCIWMQWDKEPCAWNLQVQDDDGNWIDAGHAEGTYLSEVLFLPEGVSHFRIVSRPGDRQEFHLNEMHLYGAGALPADVQVWNPPAEKADLMLLVAHPDDEVLWFGGTLPRYAGEEGRVCQVCVMVPSIACRRLELLDCLWTCGVRYYPAWGNCKDAFSFSLSEQYAVWDRYHIYDIVTGWIRRFQPDVLLTHDRFGEYGHGAHQVCADAAVQCLEMAADEAMYPDSYQMYGTWDVSKCYLHLYREGVIRMDWQTPLSAFAGKTGMQVAQEAFMCHVSQYKKGKYQVDNSGQCDCSLFGLYRSRVGADEKGDDFFEHIP